MNSLIHRACPVCESRNSTAHWRKDDLQLARCLGCGMVYASPVSTGMANGTFYDSAEADYYLSPAKLESDYSRVRFERELRLFRRFCRSGTVVDVGCSSGAFLFHLRSRWPSDYAILGTDVSGAPLAYAESRGVPVLRESLLTHDFGRQTFDACTFWAVIEHLAEPKRFLDRAAQLLKPGGLCFVLVPNLNSLAVRVLGTRYRYVYPQHLNYFTEPTLTKLCGCRFEVVALKSTHFNPIVLWQDWRSGGEEVSSEARAALLRRTTTYKQKPWLRPVKWMYSRLEQLLGAVRLADNLVIVLRKKDG